MKLYQSKKWLTKKFWHERLTEQEIAELCGVNQTTINTWLRKFGLRK